MENNDLDDLWRDLKDSKKSVTSHLSGRSAVIDNIPKARGQNKTGQNARNSNIGTSKKSTNPSCTPSLEDVAGWHVSDRNQR